MLKSLLISISLLTSVSVIGSQKFYNSATVSLGMMNHSVTPNESALVSTDGTATDESAEAAAAAVSAISLQVNWEFKSELTKSYYVSGVLPMMSAEGTGVYSTVIGINWYFGEIGTKYTYTNGGQTITITPSSKYYWGAFIGPGYVVYNTESAKFTDIFFDLGVNLGGFWRWGKDRGIRAEATVGRATGINTTGIKMGVFVGISQYL